MRLSDLVAREKKAQQDDRETKLALDREAILKTLRKGLTEEKYLALAVELKPSVEGFSLRFGNWTYVLSREQRVMAYGWGTVTQVKRDYRWPYNDSAYIESGQHLIEWLAQKGEDVRD